MQMADVFSVCFGLTPLMDPEFGKVASAALRFGLLVAEAMPDSARVLAVH